MRKLVLTLAIALSAGVFATTSDAAPLGGAGLGHAADGMSTVGQVQYVYGGRNYCWYPVGWKGPGFYWCGYANRVGFGYGGPVGWRGWTYGGPRRVGVGRVGVGHVHGARVGVARGGSVRVMGAGRGGGGHGGRGGGRRH